MTSSNGSSSAARIPPADALSALRTPPVEDRETLPDRVWTVPNALSVLRLLGVPLFLWLLLGPEADGWALVVLMVAGFSDWLDGKLARWLNQGSRLGALLDPAADRLYIVSTLIALAVRDIVPFRLAAPMPSTPRPGSGLSGPSILITSAPRSASSAVACVPCCQIVISRIRTPSNGSDMIFSSDSRLRPHCNGLKRNGGPRGTDDTSRGDDNHGEFVSFRMSGSLTERVRASIILLDLVFSEPGRVCHARSSRRPAHGRATPMVRRT